MKYKETTRNSSGLWGVNIKNIYLKKKIFYSNFRNKHKLNISLLLTYFNCKCPLSSSSSIRCQKWAGILKFYRNFAILGPKYKSVLSFSKFFNKLNKKLNDYKISLFIFLVT